MALAAPGAAPDGAAYARAVLNILEDLHAERERMQAAQPAMLNLLEDFDAEHHQLRQGQLAILNILEDAGEERRRLAQGQLAMLNILEDAGEERRQIEDTHHAILNILEDLDAERTAIGELNEELEDRVRQRTAELEHSNASLGSFTYTVAHDLRAPLRAMAGLAAALIEDYGEALDETGHDYAQRICNASARMGKLIEDLLHLARVSRAQLHREPVDLSALFRELCAELTRQHPEREIELSVQDGLCAFVDRVLFRSALQNLIDNAWKFTSGRERTEIVLGSVPANTGELRFFLRDNGVGFDNAHAGKLFQPFQSLHSAAEYPGTGVGLASVRQVVELHGGEITAEGELDRGATFFITLPIETSQK
jgi:signal transduction histidine kinase